MSELFVLVGFVLVIGGTSLVDFMAGTNVLPCQIGQDSKLKPVVDFPT